MTNRPTSLGYITQEMMNVTKNRYPKLDRALDNAKKEMLQNGLPICDFRINHSELRRDKRLIRKKEI